MKHITSAPLPPFIFHNFELYSSRYSTRYTEIYYQCSSAATLGQTWPQQQMASISQCTVHTVSHWLFTASQCTVQIAQSLYTVHSANYTVSQSLYTVSLHRAKCKLHSLPSIRNQLQSQIALKLLTMTCISGGNS